MMQHLARQISRIRYKTRLWSSFLLAHAYRWLTPLLRPRVYDCFLFSDEERLLRLRLKELDSVVDYFVILEGALTFTGADRGGFRAPTVIADLPDVVRAKVRYVPIHRWEYDETILSSPWAVETFMRNQLQRGLYGMRPWDFVWITDVDEIPNPLRVFHLGRLGMLMTYYKLNLVDFSNCWDRAKGILGIDLWFNTPEQIRHGACLSISLVPQGGWHFSYLMTEEEISRKLASFSHQEFNTEEINNSAHISRCIRDGCDLFDRPGVSFNVALDLAILPRTVQVAPHAYSEWLAAPEAVDASSSSV